MLQAASRARFYARGSYLLLQEPSSTLCTQLSPADPGSNKKAKCRLLRAVLLSCPYGWHTQQRDQSRGITPFVLLRFSKMHGHNPLAFI